MHGYGRLLLTWLRFGFGGFYARFLEVSLHCWVRRLRTVRAGCGLVARIRGRILRLGIPRACDGCVSLWRAQMVRAGRPGGSDCCLLAVVSGLRVAYCGQALAREVGGEARGGRSGLLGGQGRYEGLPFDEGGAG
jgi:hypothetical protein